MSRPAPVPPTTEGGAVSSDATVTAPRWLVEQTVSLLLQHPAAQVYILVQAWDRHVPGLIVRQP